MTSKISKKTLLIVLTALIAGLLGLGAYSYLRGTMNGSRQQEEIALPEEQPAMDLSPPTEEEQRATEDHKEKIIEEQANRSESTAEKRAVTPVITSATKHSVTGYIPGVIEDGGTCTVVATRGSDKVSKATSGFGNVSNTQCPPIDWDTPLAAGAWTITLSYSSAGAEGTSQTTREVE